MSDNRMGTNECELLAISLQKNPMPNLNTLKLFSNHLLHEYDFATDKESHLESEDNPNGITKLRSVRSNLCVVPCTSNLEGAQISKGGWLGFEFGFGGGTRKTKRNTGVHRSLTRRTHRRTARKMRRHRKHTNRSIRRKRQQVKRKSFLRRRR